MYHLPILNETSAEKARFRRKQEDQKKIVANARKKYDFKTYDQHSSHYFLTGARFNRLVFIFFHKYSIPTIFINYYSIVFFSLKKRHNRL